MALAAPASIASGENLVVTLSLRNTSRRPLYVPGDGPPECKTDWLAFVIFEGTGKPQLHDERTDCRRQPTVLLQPGEMTSYPVDLGRLSVLATSRPRFNPSPAVFYYTSPFRAATGKPTPDGRGRGRAARCRTRSASRSGKGRGPSTAPAPAGGGRVQRLSSSGVEGACEYGRLEQHHETRLGAAAGSARVHQEGDSDGLSGRKASRRRSIWMDLIAAAVAILRLPASGADRSVRSNQARCSDGRASSRGCPNRQRGVGRPRPACADSPAD